MKNFAEINRASTGAKKNFTFNHASTGAKKNFTFNPASTGAKKNFNLIEMLQGCSKRNGTAVYASNPDGQPTVKRQSRLTSYPGEMNEKEQMSSTCPRFALVLPSFCSRLDSLSLVSRQSDLGNVCGISALFSTRVWKYVAMIFAVLVMSIANIGMAWGAINNTTVTKAGSSQKYIDVKTTAASNGDEVTVAKQYIAYTINDLISNAIKGVWYTQSSSGSGSSNTDAVSITGYRATCNKHIGISSSKTYTHYVTNCVSFSALYDPRASSRYCTITATNVDDEEDVLTITNSGTVSSGTKYNVELTGLAESKYYRVVVQTNNSSDSRIYQIRLGAPACDAGDPGNISIDSFDPATSKITLKAAGSAAAGDTWYWQASASGTSTSEAYVSAGKEITAAGTYYLRSYNGECWSDAKSIEVTAADFVVKYAITKGTHVNGDFTISPTLQEAGEEVTLVASPSAGYLLDAWNIIKTADGSATGITVTNNKFTMPAYAVTVNATFVVDPCSAWGYGTANTTAPSSGNSVTVGDLTVANVGCSTSSTTPFSGGTSTGVILGNGASKYITGTLGGDEIASIRFSIYTTDAAKPTYVVAFSSSATYDAATVLKVSGDYTAYFYNDAPVATGTRKDVEVTAPAGAKSFAIGRNLSGVSHGGTEQNSGSRGVYYIAACPADEPSCEAPNHVDVTGRWDRFAGETISLTATAYSSAGTGSPIAAANITGYQWEKLVGTTWTALSNGTTDGVTTSGATTANLQIANCKATNSGKYRCVVSTGATCSTASATATDGTQGLGVKVFMLECYNDGTKTCSFTRTGDTQTGTATLTLAANTAYTFKFHVDNVYYGNNASINEDITNYVFCNSDNGGNCASNFTINSGLGGTFTLGIDYSTGGNSNVEGEPELSVTYPRKTIYLTPGVWNSGSAKFAFYYFRSGGSSGWTDFLTANDCGMSAEIPQWNGVKVNAVRLTNTCTSPNWDDKWNQTSDITISSNNSVVITDWGSGDSPYTYGTYATPTYTISYNSGTSGSGTKDDESKTCGVDFTLPGSTFTYAGHTQDGWATTDGGAIAYALSGSYTTNAAQEFFPHWKCNTPTITDNGDNTVTITVPSGTTVRYTTDGSTPTSSTGTVYSSAFTIDATVTVKAIAYQSGCTDSEIASQACTYHAPVAVQTALECNTLYTPADMLPSGKTISNSWQYDAYGLSGNTKFFIVGNGGDQSTAEADAGIVEIKTGSAVTISGTGYSNYCYFKKAPQMSGTTPTSKAIKFILSGSGSLDVYGKGALALVKEGGSPTTKDCTSTPSKVTWDNLTAGTYYLYATGTSRYMVAMQFNCCTTPAAPTAFSAGSITSTGATFSITDAANAASYDIYYSTSSDDPTSSTAATTTSTSKTKAVTGLTANTTYYAWVRSVCDADHKSAWVALTGSSFTTSAAETPIITWEMKLTSGQNWGLNGDPSTTDNTNITSISANNTHAAQLDGKTANGTMTAGCTTAQNGTARDNNIYVEFKFHVGCDKKLTPSKISLQVSNIGGSSDGNMTYDAILTDGTRTVSGSVTPASDGALTTLEFTNADASKYMQGDVTLRVYPYNNNGGNTGSGFRMGQYVKIFGEIANQATPAATITWNTQPANGRVGDPDFAYDVTCSDGSTVTVTSASTTYATIVGGKLHYVAAGTTHLIASATDACGNTVTPVNSNDFTVSAAAATYSVTHSLTNVTATSGATGAGAATEGVAYDAVFSANTGYVLPSTITVTIDGSPATVGTGYTWNASTGAFQVPAEQVTGAIVITIAGETAPATKDIYYGHVKITDGALVREIPSGATQFFTNIGGTVANNTEISLSSTPSTGGIYYNSNNLTDAELSKSSNWGTSSGSNRYVRGLKFANGATYTLALGTKVASTITFYGWCGSASKTMTVGGEEFTSSSTKNTFAKHEFIKTGGFTGNVSITQDGDFYGILVITIQTATPCTTPVIPTLSNQSLCEGADIAAWNATVTNASDISAAGETVTYSWKKKGNDTELANTATFDLGASAAESQAGTYVVTVTVSKAGYASATATKEVTLSVTDGIEVTGITADKATVYPTNSVTLTATASADAAWQWYTCTNAEGDGEAIISGAESASFTIASAGAASTYYYKAVATGSCGIGSMVYTLTVSAAAGGDCFHYVSVLPTGSDIAISSNANIVTPTHATTLEGGTMKVGSQQVVITAGYGLKMEGNKTVSITLDAALAAGNVVIVKGTSGNKGYGITINGVNFYDADNKTFDVSYTVLADDGLVGQTALTVSKYSGNSYLQEIKITGCGASCTDPEVTASADNTTACVGTSVTFTATGAHALANYQWQKLDGTWTNISGATESTYNIASVVAGDAGKYRVIARNECNRTSNEVTLSVPSVPDFGSTVPASVSVMQTIALSINTVEATDAVKYRWYKSADPTWDAGDVEIGTNKELIKAYDSEAIGSPSYYIFCRAQNACGITTSSAIAVNVTTYIEEDCATKGNEGEAQFGFENTSCSQGTYSSESAWYTNSRTKYLTYTAPEGKYFDEAKVRIAVSSGSKCGYAYSTDGGANWTYAEKTGLSSDWADVTIDLTGNVNAFRIGRNLQDGSSKDWGVTSGNFYLTKACFTYINACTATTVTPSTSSVNYEMGGEWSNPTFTLSVAGTLSYSSSNEDIASVDDDGTVTFNGEAGTVTITASYAGGTISATEYCASSGSYTINVSCPGGAPKVVADGSTDMVGCNTSVTLHAKKQDGTAFDDGTYQWYRNGEEIDGATSSSYTATQAGTYTVERTNGTGCTTPSTNSAVVTSETTEPEVERLVPFQYYHVDSIYRETSIMRFRHLFAVKNSGKLDGKSFKLYVSRNGGAATDVTSSNALVVVPNGDGHVDTVMVDLNKLSGKYSKDDELVFTCKAIDCSKNVSDVYKETITMNVIGATPTLALICSGSNKASGTRKTSELTVGGDFLTGYNVADLCQQTGNTSFDANTEWGLYTRLKENYIVTPVNGYAVFNKLNYEPFDILLLTDYPKASKSDAAATVLDDMADLCDYRPMLSFKAHMVAKQPSKWAAKGFTTSPVVPKNTRTRLNIICYAHPMFADMKTTATHIQKDNDDPTQIVYTLLTGAGYEGSKGLQGFELEAAENFVTIGLTHYNATPNDATPSAGLVTWTPGSEDRMLVTAVERQENIEARMIMFAVNCGAQSKFTETGRNVVLKCLEYLLDDDPLHVADCSFTFDNGAGNSMTAAEQAEACASCTGTKGDGKWSTAANWGPDYVVRPGKDTEVKIAAPVTVDPAVGDGAAANFTPKVRSVRILEGGKVEIPAGSYLEVVSTIRRQDGNDIYPTEVEDLHIGSSTTGNGTLIFNNSTEDTKAQVDMYSKGFIDHTDPEKEPNGVKNYQYIGTPFVEVNALYNYYGSWIYYWKADGSGWKAVKNGGPMTAWTGYCITQEAPTYHQMSGTLTATGTVDIKVPADANMVVGNSWTAPIDLGTFTTTDFENMDANVYFFNTGIDKEGTGTVSENATGETRWAAGTYVTVPVLSAEYTGEDDHIPSLQGFFVKNTGGSAGTLHLDYDKHVRGSSRAGRLSEEMHAPARRAVFSSDEPTVLKMKVSGENYDDKLLLLAREDFSTGFDNGWDGDKWDGNESALYIYTKDSEGTENSVSAVPELEGTIIGFRAGEEDDAYTLNFEYLNSDEPLYLYDSENSTYTRIMTGVTYRFFTTDNEKHERFIITRSNGQEVATGVEPTSGSLDRSKAKKLLIENKMFILRNGMLYDATGKVVK